MHGWAGIDGGPPTKKTGSQQLVVVRRRGHRWHVLHDPADFFCCLGCANGETGTGHYRLALPPAAAGLRRRLRWSSAAGWRHRRRWWSCRSGLQHPHGGAHVVHLSLQQLGLLLGQLGSVAHGDQLGGEVRCGCARCIVLVVVGCIGTDVVLAERICRVAFRSAFNPGLRFRCPAAMPSSSASCSPDMRTCRTVQACHLLCSAARGPSAFVLTSSWSATQRVGGGGNRRGTDRFQRWFRDGSSSVPATRTDGT